MKKFLLALKCFIFIVVLGGCTKEEQNASSEIYVNQFDNLDVPLLKKDVLAPTKKEAHLPPATPNQNDHVAPATALPATASLFSQGSSRKSSGGNNDDDDNLCGNNQLNPGETCDDGNFRNGDGCSNICQRECTGAHADDAIINFYTIFDVNNPTQLPIIGFTSEFMPAGEWIDNKIYTINFFGPTLLFERDAESGAVLSTTPIVGLLPAHTVTGLALDPVTKIVYASTSDGFTSELYTLELATGVLSSIGTVTNSPILIAIAIDGQGQLWGHDVINDSLISIDKGSGAGTIVGPLGFDVNFAQGMGWDPYSDTLYLTAFNNTTSQAEFRSVDRVSGNSTFLGVLGAANPGTFLNLTWLGFGFRDCNDPILPTTATATQQNRKLKSAQNVKFSSTPQLSGASMCNPQGACIGPAPVPTEQPTE